MHTNKCKLDIPYPPIEVSQKDRGYAVLLLNNYAGNNSELTALTQYFYQYLITEHQYEELAETLECISIVEMHHMEMLGELIVKLDGDPQMRTYNNCSSLYWCSNRVNPTKDIKSFLLKNIESEKTAIKNYETRISQIDDPKIQKILKRIILDEEYHIKLFENFLSDI